MLATLLLAVAAPPPTAACPRVLNGTARIAAGTAVCVGNTDGFAYLLSASHVLPPGQAQTFQFFPAAGGDKPARELVGGEELFRQTDIDLVLVRVPVKEEPLPELTLVGRGKRPRTFPAPAGAVGCPGGKPPEFRPEVVRAKVPVWSPGDPGQPRKLRGFFWETEAAPTGGMSGGPLLDKDGAVIGICSAVNLGTGRGYYTHADEILAALASGEHRWLVK